jgi:hypothetical protein
MMRKMYFKIFFLATALSFIFTANVQAQADSLKAKAIKAELLDTICKCVTQTDLSTVKTAKDAQTVIAKCFMSDGLSLFMDYATATGADMTNTDQMQDMGKKIGMQLAQTCPAMLKIMMNMAEAESNEQADSTKATTAPASSKKK